MYFFIQFKFIQCPRYRNYQVRFIKCLLVNFFEIIYIDIIIFKKIEIVKKTIDVKKSLTVFKSLHLTIIKTKSFILRKKLYNNGGQNINKSSFNRRL